LKNMIIPKQLRIVNVGIRLFYDTAVMQKIESVHVNWEPGQKLDRDIEDILDKIGG